MSDDPCDRARRAIGELCGAGAKDSNTFYLLVQSEKLGAWEREDLDVVAEAAEKVVDRIGFNIDIANTDALDYQTVMLRGTPRTLFKIPVSAINTASMEDIHELLREEMGDIGVSGDYGIRKSVWVDKAEAADLVPEMVGPPMSFDETMENTR